MLCRRCVLCSRRSRKKKKKHCFEGKGGGNVHDLGQDGARTTDHYDNSHELLYTSRDVVFPPSDATSGRTVVYVLVVYSALPKMSPSSTAQLTKKQVQQMRDWRMKYEVWSKCSSEDCAQHEHQR